MKLSRLAPVVLLAFCSAALAQSALVGKYSGYRTGQRGGQNSTELEIVSVAGDKVKAKLIRYYNRRFNTCDGEYPMEGTYGGNTLELSTVKTDNTLMGCETSLKVVVDGNKLSGTIGPNSIKIELSK